MYRIGWLADLETLAENPSRLAELKHRLGITTIWLESHLYHTGGFALSDAVWERSPFKDWRTRPGLGRHRAVHHLPEQAYPVLPGILAGVDDAPLLRILDAAHTAGLEVWGHLGLWSYAGMIYPEYSLRGLDGELMPEAEDGWGSGFCPNRAEINTWLGDCLEDCIHRYPIDGIEVDHARFLPPASLPNLLTCTCAACCASAAAAGEDLPTLAATLKAGFEAGRRLAPGQVMQLLAASASLVEALDGFLPEKAGSRWFQLRCRSIAQNLNQLAGRAHHAAGRESAFGADLFPPSVAELGGHDYADLGKLDYFTGGYGLIGWEKTALDTCAAWAAGLLRTWSDLDEAALVRQLLRLAGAAAPNQAPFVAALQRPGLSRLAQVEESEIERLAAVLPAGKPFYPPVNLAALGIEGAGRVIAKASQVGLEGFILAGLEQLSLDQVAQLGNLIQRNSSFREQA